MASYSAESRKDEEKIGSCNHEKILLTLGTYNVQIQSDQSSQAATQLKIIEPGIRSSFFLKKMAWENQSHILANLLTAKRII